MYIAKIGRVRAYVAKYESGCLLIELIRGPFCVCRGFGGKQAACDAARGLNARSVGAVNEYLEGRS